MGQILESDAIVVLASPVGSWTKGTYPENSVFPHRVQIWKAFSGDVAQYEDIHTGQNSICGISIPRNETSLIVAYRDKSGKLETGLCSNGGFDRDQWIKFLRTGEETPPRELCYQQIKQAYAAEEFLGEFSKLERPECSVHISDYDRRYKQRP